MFGKEPWHGSDPFVGDPEYDLEVPKSKRQLTVRFPAVDPVAVYLYWRAYNKGPVPSFAPAWNPQYTAQFNEAVALAEIGVVRQIMRLGGMQDATSPRTVGPSPQDYEKVPAWLYAGIIGAAGAAASIIIRGAKGGAFQTAQKYGWATKGRGPLWSVSVDVAGQLAMGYSAKGMEIIKETLAPGHGGNAMLSNPADRGRFATYGY